MKLIPAPLSTNRDECKAQFSMLLPRFFHFQIDIQDGVYVPNKTIGLNDYLEVISDCLCESHPEAHNEGSRSKSERDGFFSASTADLNDKKVTLDIHLMLSDYEKTLKWIHEWRDPSSPLCFAQDDTIELRAVFVHTNITRSLLEQYKDLPLAMTFSPPDKPQDWTEYLQASKYAQVMTIYPGPQGQTFMPEMLEKIGQIHEINPHIQVCIDGAVNDRTYPIIKSLPSLCIPDELAIGSYFSKATKQNIQSHIDTLSAQT